MALQGICKRLNAEDTEYCAKGAKFEALCFNEDAEFNDTVLTILLQ